MRWILATTLAFSVLAATPAQADLKWDGKNWAQCRVNRGGPAYSDIDVKRTIACGIDHFGQSLSIGAANYIAERESGYNEFAVSYTGCCHGVFQQHESYWAGRKAAYNRAVPRWLRVRGGIYDARANVLVSIRMMGRLGICPNWC